MASFLGDLQIPRREERALAVFSSISSWKSNLKAGYHLRCSTPRTLPQAEAGKSENNEGGCHAVRAGALARLGLQRIFRGNLRIKDTPTSAPRFQNVRPVDFMTRLTCMGDQLQPRLVVMPLSLRHLATWGRVAAPRRIQSSIWSCTVARKPSTR